jgi:ectoine hydroxylase-related dioxygenase (phytanoyl-CoA dioxygenase family)
VTDSLASSLAELHANGYCIISDAIDRSAIDKLNLDLDPIFDATPFCEGDFYGRRTKRFGGLLKRSYEAHRLARHPLVLDIAQKVMSPWCDRINLNLTQGIEIHPQAPLQYPHRDQDMWQGPKGVYEYLVNVMWPLTQFTAENGATMIWPGTHGKNHEAPAVPDKAIAAEMDPGSVLIFLGSTLHGGGANRSNKVRRGLIVSYCLGWLKPFENQWLVYPPEMAKDFDPELAALAGYSLHRPNLGNVEGQCPSMLLKGDRSDYPAAIDALRDDQAAALQEFVAGGSRI